MFFFLAASSLASFWRSCQREKMNVSCGQLAGPGELAVQKTNCHRSFGPRAVSLNQANPAIMALANLRSKYLVCKYQHWGTTRYHEYLILEESGHLGFFRHTRRGYRELAWQGWWRGTGDSSQPGFQIELRDFGCCPGVRLWHLNFTQDYGCRFTCHDRSRSFLPLMVVNSNRDDMRPWMMGLDTLATISGATTTQP